MNNTHVRATLRKKRIGVLSVQGAFIEHIHLLRSLGVDCFEIRQVHDIAHSFDGLILPGGESTVQAHLLKELQLFEPLRNLIIQGMPVLGTCAGLILLAAHIDGSGDLTCVRPFGEPQDKIVALREKEINPGDTEAFSPKSVLDTRAVVHGFQTLNVHVCRNAYGRQLASFHAQAPIHCKTPALPLASAQEQSHLMQLTFIRAPKIIAQDSCVETLVSLDDYSCAVRQDNQIACSFHPELDAEVYLHELLCEAS